ncbi:MAG: (d)CMP kinase [Prevotellaceae bacterium]|jgi:cytidylate kinase|nr:(d)CMP kinase [Prevotellaceae bacterium]
MHISITGDLGSGKSTVAKEIARILQFKYLSTGVIQRQLALEKGMNTLEFNEYTSKHPEIDDYIDQTLKDVNEQREPYVLDARLGWRFVPRSFKVYLMAMNEVAALRVLSDSQRIGEPSASDINAKIRDLLKRKAIEDERFHQKYGIKPDIFKDFNAVIDTSAASSDEVVSLILSLYERFQTENLKRTVWLSPYRIYPLKNMPRFPFNAVEEIMQKLTDGEKFAYSPVVCMLRQNEFYLYKEDCRLSAHIRLKYPFVPVALEAEDDENITPDKTVAEYITSLLDKNILIQWENEHRFIFDHYPSVLHQKTEKRDLL